MTFSVDQAQGSVPVTTLAIQGDLDGTNYKDLIELASKAQQEGAKNILIDMSELIFMSSAGLVSLLNIAKMMRGEASPESEDGWDALHDIDRDRDSGIQEHVKLLNPSPKVMKTLDISGMKQYFDIFTDKESAVASFG
jgi:anti-anti-sigma factor